MESVAADVGYPGMEPLKPEPSLYSVAAALLLSGEAALCPAEFPGKAG